MRGARHTVATYLRYGVPVALVTDDEGIARSDLTHEFLAAVQDQGLGYAALKTAVRNSLEHAFVDAGSLWRDPRAFTPVAECAGATEGLASPACAAYVRDHLKVRLQWELELPLARFEHEGTAGGSASARGR